MNKKKLIEEHNKALEALLNFVSETPEKETLSERKLLIAQLKALTIYDANKGTLSVQECADFLNKHYQTIHRWIKEEVIIAELVGGEWVIPKIQFLEKIVNEFKNQQK